MKSLRQVIKNLKTAFEYFHESNALAKKMSRSECEICRVKGLFEGGRFVIRDGPVSVLRESDLIRFFFDDMLSRMKKNGYIVRSF